MPKILLATLEYPPMIGGVGEYYRGLVEASRGSIVAMAGGQELYWRWYPRWLPMLWRIPRQMRQVGARIVFAGEVLPVGTALWILRLVTSLSPYLFISLSPVCYGVFVHGLDLALTGRKRWIARQALRRATWVIANSEHTRKIALTYGVDPEKITVLTPCPSTALTPALSRWERESASRPPRPLGEPARFASLQRAGGGRGEGWRFLTVARFVERKGYDTAVAVARLLKDRGVSFQWTFVGDGPDKARIQELTESLAVHDRIRWRSSLRSDDLAQEYQRADCFVFLPRELPNGDVEGFGMVTLEAGLFGLPVVVAASGGAAEAVVDGITGILTSPTDVQKIADDIQTILSNPQRARRMGEWGRQRALKDFRWGDRVEQLLRIIL